jgi:hypothetical protein
MAEGPLHGSLNEFHLVATTAGQKSFPLTEPEYQDKLDGISMYLR